MQLKSDVLLDKASVVSKEEFGSELDSLMSQMAILMYSKRGVGLAGPQIGDSRRILVADIGHSEGRYGMSFLKMVNPVVLTKSNSKLKSSEGCLSYPGLYTFVERPEVITVKYKTPMGEEKEEAFEGLNARIILHEMDHLDGVTLYTRASALVRKKYDKGTKAPKNSLVY